MFVSIGSCCAVKYNIDKYTGPKATLFFDWLLTDMASVNAVLGSRNINTILCCTNIVSGPADPNSLNVSSQAIQAKNARVRFQSLSYCESIHDLPASYNASRLQHFIETYRRRYQRFIDLVLQCKSTIYFLRKGTIASEDKDTFIKIIQSINPDCNFKLVELLEQMDVNHDCICEINFLSVNLDNYRTATDTHTWKCECFNWNQLFFDIANVGS